MGREMTENKNWNGTWIKERSYKDVFRNATDYADGKFNGLNNRILNLEKSIPDWDKILALDERVVCLIEKVEFTSKELQIDKLLKKLIGIEKRLDLIDEYISKKGKKRKPR